MGTARMGGLLWLLLVALAMAREADLSYLLRHPDPVLDAIMADDEGDEAFSIFLEAPSRAVHRFKGTGKPGQLTLELKTPKALYDPKSATGTYCFWPGYELFRSCRRACTGRRQHCGRLQRQGCVWWPFVEIGINEVL